MEMQSLSSSQSDDPRADSRVHIHGRGHFCAANASHSVLLRMLGNAGERQLFVVCRRSRLWLWSVSEKVAECYSPIRSPSPTCVECAL